MSSPIIIVGTGRSGTQWFARVLGIPHERAFLPEGRQASGLGQGESSVFAVPHLEDLKAEGCYIVHEVRDPRDCIPSLAAGHVMQPEGKRSRYRDFCELHYPAAFELKTAIGRASRWWIEWNRRCEEWADETIRIESVSSSDLYRWERTAGLVGTEQRMRWTPTDQNSRPRLEKPEVKKLSQPVIEMARRYGYRI